MKIMFFKIECEMIHKNKTHKNVLFEKSWN